MISFLKIRIRFPEGTGISLLSMGIIFSLCTTCYSHLLRFYKAIAYSLSYPPIIFLLKLVPRNTLLDQKSIIIFPNNQFWGQEIIWIWCVWIDDNDLIPWGSLRQLQTYAIKVVRYWSFRKGVTVKEKKTRSTGGPDVLKKSVHVQNTTLGTSRWSRG